MGTSAKVQQSLRLSREVLEYFRGTGDGWQARMDEVLLEHVRAQRGAKQEQKKSGGTLFERMSAIARSADTGAMIRGGRIGATGFEGPEVISGRVFPREAIEQNIMRDSSTGAFGTSPVVPKTSRKGAA
jgi:hypothetical protein